MMCLIFLHKDNFGFCLFLSLLNTGLPHLHRLLNLGGWQHLRRRTLQKVRNFIGCHFYKAPLELFLPVFSLHFFVFFRPILILCDISM